MTSEYILPKNNKVLKNGTTNSLKKERFFLEKERFSPNGMNVLFEKSEVYFLKVNTNIMSGAGIKAKDILVVKRNSNPKNGEIIIFILNDEMLIRRYAKINNKIQLSVDSNQLSPMNIEPGYKGFLICGVATHIIHEL